MSLQKQILLLLLSMLIFGLWSIHLGQDFSWDLRNYHFYNPYAFLHHRLDFDIAPAMIQTYFNPFLDLLNYFLITTQKPIVAGFLLGAISGITAFFIYKITLLLLEKPWLAFLATFIGMTGYASVIQLGATTNETKTACLLIIAIYSILRSLNNKEGGRNKFRNFFSDGAAPAIDAHILVRNGRKRSCGTYFVHHLHNKKAFYWIILGGFLT